VPVDIRVVRIGLARIAVSRIGVAEKGKGGTTLP
jgi:hypothetical protein